MSAKWNYFLLSSGGKVVWCELRVSRPAADDDVLVLPGPLPRRGHNERPVFPAAVMNDPELLRRVRDGLLALDVGEEWAR